MGSIASFPSTLDKGQIIPLAIKRREEYKTTHGRPQNVRVDLIVAAAKNLTGNDEEGNAATFYTKESLEEEGVKHDIDGYEDNMKVLRKMPGWNELGIRATSGADLFSTLKMTI
jgi:hypothetical protein